MYIDCGLQCTLWLLFFEMPLCVHDVRGKMVVTRKVSSFVLSTKLLGLN